MLFRKSSRTFRILVAMLLVATTVPLAAFVEPDVSPELLAKTFRHPRLYVGNVYQPATAVPESTEIVAGLASLNVDVEAAFLDRRTGRWGTLLPATPVLPGDGKGNGLSWQDLRAAAPKTLSEHRALAWNAFADYLRSHADTLGLEVAELQQPGRVDVLRGGDLVQIHVPRVVGGVPVRDSYLTAVISHGNLVLFGARNWGDVITSPEPSLTVDAAHAVVVDHLGSLADEGSWRKPHLVFVPLANGDDPNAVAVGQGLDFRLAWVLSPSFPGELAQYEALVDARSGELLLFEDTNHYLDTRLVIGGVLPVTNDGVSPDGVEQPNYPMPYAELAIGDDTLFTDAGGNLLTCTDGVATTTLSGRYMEMVDSCGEISESTSNMSLNLGTSGGTNCTVPTGASAGNTHASRSGFYEMNRIKAQARGQLPDNDWLQQQLVANMNFPLTCNAFWNGTSVNFYQSGGGCNNTGEIAAVYDHEWGHGMDDNGVNGSISNPGEGIPDVYASLRLNTSCIGRNFRATNCGGYGDACLSCTGVRDVDWANRTSGAPHAIGGATGIDTLCGSGGGAPCGGSSHCEGAVYAEAVWDLWNRDLPSVLGMSLDTAREVATELTYVGASPVGSWYSCTDGTGVGDGCNADGGYLNYLAADDTNGDLTDGTPHMEAIFDAFDRHQIACPTPSVQNDGCAVLPTSPPAVTATRFDRGVALRWNAVPNAASYRIYHTEGVFDCDFGKTLVGETSGTTFTHYNLTNGLEANYIVVPMGQDSTCYGPASSCTSATPVVRQNIIVEALPDTVTINTGDGDVFVDNCEEVSASFKVTNIGSFTVFAVHITSIKSPSHPGIDRTITFNPNLPSPVFFCESTFGSFTFEAKDLSFNETVVFDICVTSPTLDGRRVCGQLSIPYTESDLQHFGNRTFAFESGLERWDVTSGTFARTDGGGGDGTAFRLDSSAFADGACDRIRSPLMVLNNSSTLSLWNNYDIEPLSGGTWYDRANVAVVEADGTRTVVNPDSGRVYNADSSGPGSYSGCNEPEDGWAGTMNSWGTSSWSAAALNSSTFAGERVQLEVTYGTDGALSLDGFKLDQVRVTNVDLQIPDDQSDCTEDIFADGFESGDLSTWSSSSP